MIAEHSTRIMTGTYSDSQNRLRARQVRHPLAQVLVRERDVPRLLGHVDGHHPLHDRVQGLALAQHVLLGVVDGLLAGEDAEAERDRQRAGDQRDDRREPLAAAAACRARRRRCGSPSPGTSWCGCTLRPPRAGSSGTPASRWAPRTRTPSGRGSGSTRSAGRPWRRWPAATCRSRSAARPDCDWYQGCRPIGSVAGRIQRSSFVDDGELRRVPVDVGVRVEVASHRPLGQCGQHVDVRGVVAHFHVAAPAPDDASAVLTAMTEPPRPR